ncbi:DNA repair protein RecO [Collinsella stercoris]|uniref:DNA repair protein RecO n=1 Tax=Collinsella stercoris TaxID=147206 RepID=UPI003AF13D13
MAGSRTYRTKAIVLDKTKLKETDLILTLVGESGRQIRAVAKGARKPGSRLAARCELCCEVDVLLAHGRNLDIVSQADLIAAPLGAQPSYELLTAASAVAEVAEKCTYEDAEDPFVYAITRAVLAHLAAAGADTPVEDPAHLDLLVAAYIFKLLSHVGYRPDYSACVACGDPSPGYFSAQAGGLLCASCASGVPGCEPVDANMARWLEGLVSMRFSELAIAPIDSHTAAHMLGLAHLWAATHLECRLRALEFLLGR